MTDPTEAERLAAVLNGDYKRGSTPTWGTIREVAVTLTRLQQERDAAGGLAKSHEQEIEHLQSSIQSLRAEYKICRERLMVLADAAVERDAAIREAEALRAANRDWQCPACYWHAGHEPEEWFREEAALRGFSLSTPTGQGDAK